VAVGCPRGDAKPVERPDPQLRRDEELTEEQAAYLQRLADDADAHPDDYGALKASGMAHMRYTLSGVISLQERAERDLEAAFALDRGDPQLNLSLGRFYNMRAVVGDDSKAEKQVEVYGALLGNQKPAEMASSDFVAWSFFQLGRVLTQKNRGKLLSALSTIKDLEEQLSDRTKQHPDDIEMYALAGNFAFFFAGNIPFGKKDRVEAAVTYFETLRVRWAELRPGAKDPDNCPNTYENFMFELAEGRLVLGRVDEAKEIYQELSQIRGPQTRAKEQIAYVSAERLRNADRYVGDMDLMPPWPSDVGNCVVCHSWTSDVALDTLKSVDRIVLDDIPTKAVPKPVKLASAVPERVRSIVEHRCVPCHRRGGQAQRYADFSADEGVLARANAIVRRADRGDMPPTGPLPEAEQEALRAWLQSLRE
jgi:hypothetical protein